MGWNYEIPLLFWSRAGLEFVDTYDLFPTSKIDFGPGYRIYLGKDSESFITLLGGVTKKVQQRDIDVAIANWKIYKDRKQEKK